MCRSYEPPHSMRPFYLFIGYHYKDGPGVVPWNIQMDTWSTLIYRWFYILSHCSLRLWSQMKRLKINDEANYVLLEYFKSCRNNFLQKSTVMRISVKKCFFTHTFYIKFYWWREGVVQSVSLCKKFEKCIFGINVPK